MKFGVIIQKDELHKTCDYFSWAVIPLNKRGTGTREPTDCIHWSTTLLRKGTRATRRSRRTRLLHHVNPGNSRDPVPSRSNRRRQGRFRKVSLRLGMRLGLSLPMTVRTDGESSSSRRGGWRGGRGRWQRWKRWAWRRPRLFSGVSLSLVAHASVRSAKHDKTFRNIWRKGQNRRLYILHCFQHYQQNKKWTKNLEICYQTNPCSLKPAHLHPPATWIMPTTHKTE